MTASATPALLADARRRDGRAAVSGRGHVELRRPVQAAPRALFD